MMNNIYEMISIIFGVKIEIIESDSCDILDSLCDCINLND